MALKSLTSPLKIVGNTPAPAVPPRMLAAALSGRFTPSTMPPHLQGAYRSDPRNRSINQLSDMALDSSPIQSTWQGIARLGAAYFGKRKQDQIDDEFAMKDDAYRKALIAALQGAQTGNMAGFTNPDLGPTAIQATIQNAQFNREQAANEAGYQRTRTDQIDDAQTAHERQLEIAGMKNNQPLTREAKAAADYKAGRIPAQAYQQIMASAGKGGVTVNTGQQETAMEKELGKLFANDYATRAKAAADAASTVEQLGILDGLLDAGLQTGFGQQFITGARKLGAQIGFDVDKSQMAGAELFSAVSNRMIGPLVKQLGQNPTDKDLQFIVQSAAELGKSPQGNKLIIQALKRDQQRKIQLSQLQSKYYAANKTMAGFENVVANHITKNPIFSNAERLQLAGLRKGAPQAGLPQSGNKMRRRWNPKTGELEPVGNPLAGVGNSQLNSGVTGAFPPR